MRYGPLLSVGGARVALTRASLDVSELAHITNDNPHFDLLTLPAHGRIMVKSPRRRRAVPSDPTFTEVSEFTFEDVVYTRVYYVADPGVKAAQDKVTYRLSARGVPPAQGELVIQLEPQVRSRSYRHTHTHTHTHTHRGSW